VAVLFGLKDLLNYRQKLHEYFGYAALLDYGNTWNGWKQMAIKDIAVAVGLGIRVYTPIAPFRLDFGAKFYDPKDNKMIFKKEFSG
jgi:outer membrane translocation and assembly module TamA